jgi:hypothetical protein
MMMMILKLLYNINNNNDDVESNDHCHHISLSLSINISFDISIGNGLLSDPLLHRVIYGLMSKLFQKLINGFKKLGTKIIYADFSRVMINTNKNVS